MHNLLLKIYASRICMPSTILCNPATPVPLLVFPAHEIVEVEGFLFKRKRRIPLGESDNVQASAKKARSQENVDAVQSEEGGSVQAGPPRRDAQVRMIPNKVDGAPSCLP